MDATASAGNLLYAPFSLIPPEITLKIYEFLMAPKWNRDFLPYGMVCREWRTIAKQNGCYVLRRLGPSRMLDLYMFLLSETDWSIGVKHLEVSCRDGELGVLAKVISVSPRLKTFSLALLSFDDSDDWDNEDGMESLRGQARVGESLSQLRGLEHLESYYVHIGADQLVRGLQNWTNLRSVVLRSGITGDLTILSLLLPRHVPHLKEFIMPTSTRETIALASHVLSFNTIVSLGLGRSPFRANIQGSWDELERALSQHAGRLLRYEYINTNQNPELTQSIYHSLVSCRTLAIAFPFDERNHPFQFPTPAQLPALRHFRVHNYTSTDESAIEQFIRSRLSPLESLAINDAYTDDEDEVELQEESRGRLEAVCEEMGIAFEIWN